VTGRARFAVAARRVGSKSPDCAPTPEPLAWLADIGMLMGAAAGGVRLGDLRDTDAYEQWMPAVAESLAGLHDLRVDGLPSWPAHAAVRDLASAAEAVGRLVPGVAPLASSLGRRLAPFLAAAGGEPAASHGSFHDDRVLVGDSGVTLIDTDGAMRANPLTDVGHFLAYLTADGAEGARARFLDAYFSARPPRGDGYLPFEAASLLRWATLPFRELRPDWPDAVEQRVRMAADRQAGHGRGRQPLQPPSVRECHGPDP
jgi:aminoglycoside phosphotransferase (APT) family kinase protein